MAHQPDVNHDDEVLMKVANKVMDDLGKTVEAQGLCLACTVYHVARIAVANALVQHPHIHPDIFMSMLYEAAGHLILADAFGSLDPKQATHPQQAGKVN